MLEGDVIVGRASTVLRCISTLRRILRLRLCRGRVLRCGRGLLILRRRRGGLIGGCRSRGLSLDLRLSLSLVEELELQTNDFGLVVLLPLLVLPGTGLDFPADVEHRTLADILLRDVGQPSVEDDVVPFGRILSLPRPVRVGFVGGEGEGGEFVPAFKVTDFGVFPHPSDEVY